MSRAKDFRQAYDDELQRKIANVQEIVENAIAEVSGKQASVNAAMNSALLQGPHGQTVFEAIKRYYESEEQGWIVTKRSEGTTVYIDLSPRP